MTTPKHTVHSFEQELAHLKKYLLRMSGLVEQQLAQSLTLLRMHDLQIAHNIINEDKQVDSLEREIETHAIRLLALRAPMAQDLREIVSSLKISSNLERIGDLAASISRHISEADTLPMPFPLTSFHLLGEQIQDSYQKTILALTQMDKEMVFYLWSADERIDQSYNDIIYEIIHIMAEHKEHLPLCSRLLLVAKNMERIGDHLTNIAEYIYYIVTGDFLPPNVRGKKNPLH